MGAQRRAEPIHGAMRFAEPVDGERGAALVALQRLTWRQRRTAGRALQRRLAGRLLVDGLGFDHAFGVERARESGDVEQAGNGLAVGALFVVSAERRAAVDAVDAAVAREQAGTVDARERPQQPFLLQELGE